MYCENCGKEIKEGNIYCTNCGTLINEPTINKEPIKIKFNHLLIGLLILIVLIIIVVVFFINTKKDNAINSNNNIQETETNVSDIKQYQVEIGKEYSYVLDEETGSIRFNTNTDFIIRTGIVNSESLIETGTYIINGNTITLTVNYNSNNDYGDEEENPNYVSIPYEKEMTILDDGNIEYKTDYGTYLYIKEGGTDTNNNNNSLLDQIYSKYPDLKNKEGYICTDGEQYWILDNAGEKIYFTDMESFESALVQCYTSEQTNPNSSENLGNETNGRENGTNSNLSEAELKYSQIEKGMSYYQVYAILGKPTSVTNSGGAKNCIWTISGKVILVQFMNDIVYQKIFNKNESATSKPLDPATTHFIHYSEGFALEEYTTQLDEWGIKYEIVKEENLNFNHNVVTKIEPNYCNIDKNTIVKLTVSDNTYTMDVVVDTMYLLKLAGIETQKYNSEYNYEEGRTVGDKVSLQLKINGQTIFNGDTEALSITHALTLGKIKGKPTDTYKIEATIEGVKIQKSINYYTWCSKDNSTFRIYEGGDIGAG